MEHDRPPADETQPMDPVEQILSGLGYAETPAMRELRDQIGAIAPGEDEDPRHDPAIESITHFQDLAHQVVTDAMVPGESAEQSIWFAAQLAIMELYRRTGRRVMYRDQALDVLTTGSHDPQLDLILRELVAKGIIEREIVDEWNDLEEYL